VLATVTGAVATAAVAALLGLLPAQLSLPGVALAALVGVIALTALVFRRAVRPVSVTGSQNAAPRSDPVGSDATRHAGDPILRIPRWLFYAGALTVGQGTLRPALGLTVSEIFFIAAFGCAVFAVLLGRPMARLPVALVLGVGIFAVGGLISSPGAVSPFASEATVLQGVYVMLLWIWTGATVLRTRAHVLTALALWTISAGLDGFTAITQVAGISALAGPLEGTRATGLTDHPNDLGGVCAIALVPALMLATSRFSGSSVRPPGSFKGLFRWIVLSLVAAGLVLSASVGSMLAAFLAIVVWLIAPAVRAPGRVAVVTALAFTVLAVMLAGGRITSPTERVAQVTDTNGISATSGSGGVRVRTVERALPRIASDPLIGTGLDATGGTVNVISQGTSAKYQVHGQPISAWYQAGFLGFLGILIVVVTLARSSWRAVATGDRQGHLIGLAIFAAFVAFLIHALSTPFYFQQYQWITGVMLLAWTLRRDATVPVFAGGGREQVQVIGMARPLPQQA